MNGLYAVTLWSNWDKHTGIHQIEKVISHSTFYAINNFWYYQLSNFVSIQTEVFFSLSVPLAVSSISNFRQPTVSCMTEGMTNGKRFPKTYHINPVESKNEFHWDRQRYMEWMEKQLNESLSNLVSRNIWIKLNSKWKVFTVGHISKFWYLCNRVII